VGTKHAGSFLHRLQTAAHRPQAPRVEKGSRPEDGAVGPEVGEGFLQLPGPGGGELAGQQGLELLPGPPPYSTAPAQPRPALALPAARRRELSARRTWSTA
jgi:hypothetical protein